MHFLAWLFSSGCRFYWFSCFDVDGVVFVGVVVFVLLWSVVEFGFVSLSFLNCWFVVLLLLVSLDFLVWLALTVFWLYWFSCFGVFDGVVFIGFIVFWRWVLLELLMFH